MAEYTKYDFLLKKYDVAKDNYELLFNKINKLWDQISINKEIGFLKNASRKKFIDYMFKNSDLCKIIINELNDSLNKLKKYNGEKSNTYILDKTYNNLNNLYENHKSMVDKSEEDKDILKKYDILFNILEESTG
jgi:hypothetical protein